MILHVACLPFPSYQGTQAALDAMLRASCEAGHHIELLVYAHAAYPLDAPYPIHRVADFPRVRSLRSGPSLGKVVLDGRCIGKMRKLVRRARPKAVVAHHIEAALVGLAARVRPLYYVAHTSLMHELPVYLPALLGPLASLCGAKGERLVCRLSDGVAAVAPSLASRMGRNARHLPVPWKKAPTSLQLTRSGARAALGLPSAAPLCLYAGNLDRYQGWEDVVAALSCLRLTHPNASLLIATESNPRSVHQRAQSSELHDAVYVRRLDGERARALAHAASNLAWVPRRTEGGVPVKMLDAFARGLPVVATERALAGLPAADSCIVVVNDSPGALAEGARRLIDDALARETLRQRAFDYLATHHGTSAFDVAMAELLEARATAGTKRSEPHRRAWAALRAR